MLTKGWPTLDPARGKVLFFFDNGGAGEIRDLYRAGKPNLEGRAVFTRGPEGQPDAAVTMVNDPRGANQAEIQRLVRKGYLVRTRSDEPMSTIADKRLQPGRDRAGQRCPGGHHRLPGRRAWPPATTVTSSRSCLGDTAVRCNPVSAPTWCRGNVSER